ncbi:MAG: SGNH/GDSL hydrolase family protein [Pseudomonadota bacterium]
MMALVGRLVAVVLLIGLAFAVYAFWPHMRAAPDVADRPMPPLPDGPISLVAFGTSLTARNAWPEALAERLETCRSSPVTLTRVARPGAGSAWAQTQVAQVVAAAPDLVVMEFAINDADLLDGVSPATGHRQHAEILQALRTDLPEARILLMTMNPAYGPRGWVRPMLRRHYLGYRDLAVEFDTGLADLYPRWVQLQDRAARRPPDGLHPTDAQTAPVVLGAVAPLLGCA